MVLKNPSFFLVMLWNAAQGLVRTGECSLVCCAPSPRLYEAQASHGLMIPPTSASGGTQFPTVFFVFSMGLSPGPHLCQAEALVLSPNPFTLRGRGILSPAELKPSCLSLLVARCVCR